MGALERLAEAQISSNLGDDALRLSDVDYIRASGWAAQTNPEGLMLYRLKYANDHTEYKLAMSRVRVLATGKAFRMRLTISKGDLTELAENTLRHWVAPICPACLGRSFEVIAGTPTLSETECKHCQGHGRLSLRKIVRNNIDLAEWLSQKMDSLTGAFIASAKNAAQD